MGKRLYIVKSSVEVLDKLVKSLYDRHSGIDTVELLQTRCRQVNPKFNVPYVRLEPFGIKRVEYTDGTGETIRLGKNTTDKEIDDYLLGFLKENLKVDTLIWFKCETGYDWSKTFPALMKEYELKVDDLTLSPEEIKVPKYVDREISRSVI